MAIRLSNIRLSVDATEQEVLPRLAAALEVPEHEIARWRILRKSFDARDKRDLAFVYSAEVAFAGDDRTGVDEPGLIARVKSRRGPVQAEPFSEPPFELPPAGSAALPERPVIVGSGPAGLVAGVCLAAQGYRPLVLERGRAVRDRIRDVRQFEEGGDFDPESNYLFGEGGAGTFSDGKLTCRMSGADVRWVLQLLAESKGKPSILYDHRPHLGSNRLPAVVKALRQKIEQLGGEVRFQCRVEDIRRDGDRVIGVQTSSGYIPASVVVLAIGHSARDTYEMLLARGVSMVQKPFQIGVRIEQPQVNVNRFQYGSRMLEERLGAADYSLIAHGRLDLFTFCMCAGGQVIPSVSEAGYFCTNGMSLSRRDSPFANSGLMVTLGPEHFGSKHVLAGMVLQREHEKRAFELGRGEYRVPIQWASDLLAKRKTKDKPPTSYERGVIPTDLANVIPVPVLGALRDGLPILDRKWRGKFLEQATLVGPEARGSSPVRLPRDPRTFESVGLSGLYPIGEGCGYAGGIVSAAVDGLRCAKAIIARYAPLEPRAAKEPPLATSPISQAR